MKHFWSPLGKNNCLLISGTLKCVVHRVCYSSLAEPTATNPISKLITKPKMLCTEAKILPGGVMVQIKIIFGTHHVKR